MKISFLHIFWILLLNFSLLNISAQQATQIKKVGGFSHPESVVLDENGGFLYVSNIGEKKEGDGFISKISINGEIIDHKWITGLNDPKGLLYLNNVLWVTDNTDLVLINLEKAEIVDRIPVQDASFLNDIAVGKNGIIYISDTGKSSIYKREGTGEISEWMKTEELEFPNGLLVVEEHLYVAAWGGENPGNVLRVNLNTCKIEKVTEKGLGNLDGIQQVGSTSLGNLSFYVSDWATGKVYWVEPGKASSEILTSEKSAGDILYIPVTDLIIIPMNIQNEVWWYQLK